MAFRYVVKRVKIILRCYEPKSLYHQDRKSIENEMTMMNPIAKKILSIVLLMLLVIGAAADDEIDPDADVNVTINAPEYVSEDMFEVTMDVTEVTDFDSGQFDLTYNPDVINVLKVEAGDIDDTEIPIDDWRPMDDDRIRVLFNIPGADGVSGSGYLAKIIFEVVGGTGDTSAIDVITDPDEGAEPNLADADADEITANWFGTTVTIGTAPPESAETPTLTSTPTIAAASAPEPTATSIETPSLMLASDPSALTARAQGVPEVSSEKDESQDIPTPHNFIAIYSFVGLLAFIYALTLFK